MDNTILLIQLPSHDGGREDSLAAALAERKIAGHTLLEWVVRRAMDVQRVDRIVVVLSQQDADRSRAQELPADIPVLVVSEEDRLGQICCVLKKYPAHGVVRVSVDSPFVDPILIDRLIVAAESHPACDYIGFCFGNGRPVVQCRVGIFADWCCAETVLQMDREIRDVKIRRNMTEYFCSHPETFCLRLIPVPPELDRDELYAADTADWERLQEIFEALGPDGLEMHRIATLLN